MPQSKATPLSKTPSSFSVTSTSSTTSSFRNLYTLDSCGHNLSYKYITPKRSSSSVPFRRCAYTLDGQGMDFSSSYYKSYAAPRQQNYNGVPPSYDYTSPLGFRSLYTLDWTPCRFGKKA